MLARAFLPPFAVSAIFFAASAYYEYISGLNDAPGVAEDCLCLALAGLFLTAPVHLIVVWISAKIHWPVAKIYGVAVVVLGPLFGFFCPVLLVFTVPLAFAAVIVDSLCNRIAQRETQRINAFVISRAITLRSSAHTS